MLVRWIPLAVATFAVGTDGFVIAGLLPAIAADLKVDISAAGQLVSVFALTMAVSAPVLGAATSGLDRRSALLAALIVFAVGNVATAMATSYAAAMAARVVAAAGAGIINSTAAGAAVAMAEPHRRGRALAVVMGGLSAASPIGLPLGMLIGGADWHVTMWAVAALSLLAAAGIAAGLPRIVVPVPPLRARLAHLARPRVLAVLAVSVATLAGVYVLYTYIGAALAGATGGSADLLTIVLGISGVGIVVGTVLAGRLTDVHGAERVLLLALGGIAVVMAAGALVAASLVAAVAWAGIWGIAVGFPVVAQQHRLVADAPEAAPILLGLNSSAVYLGIALGGGIGGLAQAWMAPSALGLLGAGIVAAGLVLTLVTRRSAARSVGSVA